MVVRSWPPEAPSHGLLGNDAARRTAARRHDWSSSQQPLYNSSKERSLSSRRASTCLPVRLERRTMHGTNNNARQQTPLACWRGFAAVIQHLATHDLSSALSATELESRLIELGFVEGARRRGAARGHRRARPDRGAGRERHHRGARGARRWPSSSPDETRDEAMEAPLMHLALVGTPNSGKTSLFNALTGSRQKVANYPGVTVERKEGSFVTPLGRQVSVVDLPGTYSLRGRSPDEEITRDMVLGRTAGRDAARPRALRGRFHQSAADHPPRARTQAHRPAADAGAQHVRHRDPPRRQRRCGGIVRSARAYPS